MVEITRIVQVKVCDVCGEDIDEPAYDCPVCGKEICYWCRVDFHITLGAEDKGSHSRYIIPEGLTNGRNFVCSLCANTMAQEIVRKIRPLQ